MGAGIYSVFRHCARSKKVVQNLPNHRGIAEASHGVKRSINLKKMYVCFVLCFTISTLFLTRQFVKLP